MSYCDLDDIGAAIPEQDLIELTDDSGLQVVNETAVNRAIEAADELIDTSIRGRYSLPLAVVPPLIKTLAVDIAVWRIYGRRRTLNMPEAVTLGYKEAVRLLTQIANGAMVLDLPTSPVTAAIGGPVVSAPERLFPRDTLRRF